jgi:alpha-tubulin suppressor-like RCC1 family protein
MTPMDNVARMIPQEILIHHLLKIESSILFRSYHLFLFKKHLKNIVKIASGSNHNIALDHGGNLFGWGSNSNMQLSHEDDFSAMNAPLLCTYKAIKIYKNLDAN